MCQELTVKNLCKIRWNLGILVSGFLLFVHVCSPFDTWSLRPICHGSRWIKTPSGMSNVCDSHLETTRALNSPSWNMGLLIWIHKFCLLCMNLVVWLKSDSMAMATAQQPTESNYSHFCYDWSSRCAQTHLIRSCLTSLGAVFSFFDEKDIPAKVTAIYVTLPLVAAAALLHFPVAWLIRRLYRRTSFSEALDEYRKQIHCKPFTGPDATHPRNQGLQALTLRGLWKHFERFSPFSAKVLLSCFVSEGVLVQTWVAHKYSSG